MVRTLPHPAPLSDIDPKRVAGNAFVVALHVVVFAVLMMPARMDPPAPDVEDEPPFFVPIVHEPIIPPTPPPPVPVTPTPVQITPTPIVRHEAPPVDVAPVFESGEIAAEVVDEVGPPVQTFDPTPQLATLTYAHNPAPRYPPRSIRAGDEGQVLLRVLVDANGNPIDVTIERSSGHRELDRAAREQVLTKWKFNPSQRGGVPVPAYALVPIDFILP